MKLPVRRHVQGKVIEFRNVPGTECKNSECGIQTFDSLVIERLENISDSIDLFDFESGHVEYDEYKSYDEWQKELMIEIMDPDGFRSLVGNWRDPSFLFSRKEFEKRLTPCTFRDLLGRKDRLGGVDDIIDNTFREAMKDKAKKDKAASSNIQNLMEIKRMAENSGPTFGGSSTAEAIRRHIDKYLSRLVPNSECKVETTSVDEEKGIVQVRITVPKWFAERMGLDEQGEAEASSGEEAE